MAKNRVLIFVLAGSLAVLSFAVFSSCLPNSFVNWDDEGYVTQNRALREFSLPGLQKIFSTFSEGHYHPLTMAVFWLEYRFFGLDPFPYHLVNLLVHSLNCVLIFWFIFLLFDSPASAWITAALFAVHPLQVESVAWIAELKNPLYVMFFAFALISYVHYLSVGLKWKYLAFSWIFFVVSLLCKSMAITLPLVMFLLDHVKGRKISRGMFLEKIPFAVMSVLFAWLAVRAVNSIGFMKYGGHAGVPEQMLAAVNSLAHHLSKIFAPAGLSCLYPPGRGGNIWMILLPAVLFLGIAFCISIRPKYAKKAIFGTGLFLITLSPMLQSIPNSHAMVADHHVYFSSVGIFFLFAEIIAFFLARSGKAKFFFKSAAVLAASAVISVSAVLSLERCEVWADSITLWSDAISKSRTADIPVAYFNRAVQYAYQNRHEEAVADLKIALVQYDGPAVTEGIPAHGTGPARLYGFLGTQFAKIGLIMEAAVLFNLSLNLDPGAARVFSDLCAAYGDMGRIKESAAAGERSVELDPVYAPARYNLSCAYFISGKFDLALEQARTASDLGYPVPVEYMDELERNASRSAK